MMRRLWKIMVSVFVLSVLMGMTAFAAGLDDRTGKKQFQMVV